MSFSIVAKAEGGWQHQGDQAARNIVARGDPGLCHGQQCVDIDIDIDIFIIIIDPALCTEAPHSTLRQSHLAYRNIPTGSSSLALLLVIRPWSL